LTHFAIFDAERNGNMLLLKPTGGVMNVDAGEMVEILAGELQIYLGTNYLKPLAA